MYLNLCPQTIGITDTNLAQLMALAVKHGFKGIDLQAEQLASLDAAREAKAMLQQHELQWGLFFLPADFLQIPDSKLEEALAVLDRSLPLIQAAGCERTYNHMWPGSNNLVFEANYQWHQRRIRILHERLQSYGITLGIEAVGPKTLQKGPCPMLR